MAAWEHADDAVKPPYPCGIFALRLLVPQLFLLAWLVCLWLACHNTTLSEATYAGETLEIVVGPACVMPPPVRDFPQR